MVWRRGKATSGLNGPVEEVRLMDAECGKVRQGWAMVVRQVQYGL